MSIFSVRNGGLAVYGGIIGAVIAIVCVAKYKKHKFLHIMDFGIIFIPLGQAIGRWGNFFNQEAYGSVTKMPWGMTGSSIEKELMAEGYDVGSLVHPTFLYESLWCFALFALLFVYSRKWKKNHGECIALYMMLYGLERALVEGLRTDSLYIGSTNLRVSQVLSIILIVLGIALFIDCRRRVKNSQTNETKIEEEDSGLSDIIKIYDASLEAEGEKELSELLAEQSAEIDNYSSVDTQINEDNE